MLLVEEGEEIEAKCSVDFGSHTMDPAALHTYLEMKVHHLIKGRTWDKIHVVPSYDRTSIISSSEKKGKMFNWHRPTAVVRGDELIVRCFPGVDYVRHYGLIIATYLKMEGTVGDVRCMVPRAADVTASLGHLDVDASRSHLVVVGWALEHLAGAEGWTLGMGYAWKTKTVGGKTVLYLGFFHSIWGDVAGAVVSRLASCGAQRVVYVGKVGGLQRGVTPNTWLATGGSSVVDGVTHEWKNYFSGVASGCSGVLTGTHVTSPSILTEDQAWLEGNRQHSFVDPEIGPMGIAANAAGIEFGYLHIISNNLAVKYDHDLSNERVEGVVRRRALLIEKIRELIENSVYQRAES